MARRFQAPLAVQLADRDAERVRRSHAGCILELQQVPSARAVIVRDVQLGDALEVFVPHGLGREGAAWLSAPRASASATTGRIREIRNGGVDRTRYVCLKAEGWGETIVVDVEVK